MPPVWQAQMALRHRLSDRKGKGIIPEMKEKRKITHCDRILRFLEWNQGSTVLDIATQLRISNPSARLSELRKAGLIDTIRCEETNASGETIRFCRYYARKEKNNA